MNEQQKKRFDEIVDGIIEVLNKEPEFLEEYKACKKSDIVMYHHSLGRFIRNEFGLWQDSILTERWRNDEASHDIREGVDYSEDHPDAMSTKLMEAVWDKLQK